MLNGKVRHVHREAYCLMWYECQTCPCKLRIYNARDGVTPFGTTCPSCGGAEFYHSIRKLEYHPEHKLHRGQYYWKNGTLAEWEAVFKKLYDDRYFADLPQLERNYMAKNAARDAFKLGSPLLGVNL